MNQSDTIAKLILILSPLVVIYIVSTVIWIITLINLIKSNISEFRNPQDKTYWVILSIFLSPFSLYYFYNVILKKKPKNTLEIDKGLIVMIVLMVIFFIIGIIYTVIFYFWGVSFFIPEENQLSDSFKIYCTDLNSNNDTHAYFTNAELYNEAKTNFEGCISLSNITSFSEHTTNQRSTISIVGDVKYKNGLTEKLQIDYLKIGNDWKFDSIDTANQ